MCCSFAGFPIKSKLTLSLFSWKTSTFPKLLNGSGYVTQYPCNILAENKFSSKGICSRTSSEPFSIHLLVARFILLTLSAWQQAYSKENK